MALARAIEKKCEVRQIQAYEMEDQLPQNVEVKFRKPPGPDEYWQWKGGGEGSNSHGQVLGQGADDETDDECAGMDDDERIGCQTDTWDGCSAILGAEGDLLEDVNVNGIGPVPIPTSIADPTPNLQEMKCRQNPGARTMATAELFEQSVVVLGGKRELNGGYMRDVWARDDHLPTARIKTRPNSRTSQATFEFDTDTAGASVFEYKVVDADEKQEVIPWTVTTRTQGADVSHLLDSQPVDFKGPGTGRYLFYLRALDPAGNAGYQFEDGNVYLWLYVTPLPWVWFIGIIIFATSFLIFLFMEYRRRKKKAAMERYAIKRMRRKFKGQAKGDAPKGQDWRQIHAEDAGGKGGKKDKKMKKKKKEKSDKKKGLKDRTTKKDDKKKKKKSSKEKDKEKASKSKDKKKAKSGGKDKDKSKSKQKDKDKRKQKESKEGDRSKKKDSKAKDKERSKKGDKERTKEGDKERKKEK